MGKLFSVITRVAIWGALGAAIAVVGLVAYQMAFTGGATRHDFSMEAASKAGAIGFIVGGVIGFFRRS